MNPRPILLSLSVFLWCLPMHAVAADWGIYGATICAAPGERSTSTSWGLAAPDGAGGAYMGWSDGRSGIPRIFLQRVTSGGGPTPGWAFHGIPASSWTPIRQIRPSLAADPQGGVFIVWLEGEDSWENPYHAVRVTRLGESGAPKPTWPASGVVVGTNANSFFDPAVVPDASGGAFVMWRSSTSAQEMYLNLHHVLGDGGLDPLWPVGGLIVAQNANNLNPAIATDGLGGVLLAWDESRFPDEGIHYRAQRILVDGAPAPGWDPAGVLIRTTSTPNNTWRAPGITPDGTGGAIVAFREFKDGEQHFGLYARRVTSGGAFASGWANEGTPVATTPPSAGRFGIVSDGGSGAILFWESFETGAVFPPWRIWAQRLGANGLVPAGWPAGGRRIGSADRYSINPVGLSDGAGGAFITWSEPDETGDERLHVHHVEADGSDALGWGPQGAELAPGIPNDRTQSGVSLARSASGIFAFWSDYTIPPNGINVLGQRFDPAPPTDVGPPQVGAKGLRVHPNPALATVQVHLLTPGRVSVTVHDLAGRRVRSLEEHFVAFPGGRPWTWDLRDDHGRRVAPGVYRIVARGEGEVEAASVVVLR